MYPKSKKWHILHYVTVKKNDRRVVHITRLMRGAKLSPDHNLVVSEMALRIHPVFCQRSGKRIVGLPEGVHVPPPDLLMGPGFLINK